MIFFELISKKIGFARVGRFSKSIALKKFIKTPHIVIPINKKLINQLSFIEEFEEQGLFIIFKEKYLKMELFWDKFKNISLLYTHTGTLEKFQEIIVRNLEIFSKDNVIAIIPFNIPTTTISKEFAKREIEKYIYIANKILKSNPNLNFGLSLKIFDYSELFNLYISIIKNNENIRILNLVDIFDNFSNYRNILKIIIQIKQELDNNLVLMVSGRITPKFYPILIYLGIDLIDSSYLLYLSSENFYATIEYLLPIYKMKFLPCSCVACGGKLKFLLEEKYSLEKIDLLCLHNLITARNYLNKVKQYLITEDYRAFVEKSSLDNINMISMLKLLDKRYFEIIRYETPLIQENKKINCLGPSSYYRPDFQEFRERTIKNFEPEPSTRLILLLPCSKKKPYSESKSHKQFLNVIRNFPEFPDFQEIILTSPLGAIPRQLENVYPINSYDISVTGDWDHEELNIASKMLIRLLEKYDDKNIPIICHLEGGYLEIVKRAMAKLPFKFYFSEIHERITSKKSLISLQNLIQENKNKVMPKNGFSKGDYLSNTWTRKFIKILDYQFGAGSGLKVIINKLNLRKNRNNTRIELIEANSRALLGVFNKASGLIALTIKGARRLESFSTSSTIVFNGDELRGNTLFRAGILESSQNLIPNNQVFILDQEKKDIIGVGQLIVGSNFIKNSKTGRVAKIHEKCK